LLTKGTAPNPLQSRLSLQLLCGGFYGNLLHHSRDLSLCVWRALEVAPVVRAFFFFLHFV
jgi:hypothetical protein